jgi:hypothetical protein
VNIDRIVLTTFAGYFNSQILCLRSIEQHAAGYPVDIIIDDFDIAHWPSYPEDCEAYIATNFPNLDISFHRFSQFPGMHLVRTGGWFRQQLIKLYLDTIVTGHKWLLVDADVVFLEPPRSNTISATVRQEPSPIDIGNRLYVQFMLDCERPWVIRDDQYWCLSSVPFRFLDRSLLQDLRDKIQTVHKQTLFDLHVDLFNKDKLVAFDPMSSTMIMSEFQLIEIYRHRYSAQPLPIGLYTASNFCHTSVKDWTQTRSFFEQQDIPVSDLHWESLQIFGQHHV